MGDGVLSHHGKNTIPLRRSYFRASDRAFRLFFEQSSDAILLVDDDMVVDCNQAAARLFGYGDRKQMRAVRLKDLMPEHEIDTNPSSEEAKDRFGTVLKKGETSFDSVCRRCTGEEFPAEILLTPLAMKDRSVFFAAVRDVTERRRTEAQVRSAYHATRVLLERAPVGVIMVNEKGAVEYVNDALGHISGNDPAILRRINAFDFPGFQENGISKSIKVGLSGIPFSMGPMEYTSRFSGKTMVLTLTGIPLEEPEGRKLVIYVEDVTTRKRAEEVLQKEKQTFLSILEKIPYGIVLSDEKGEFLYVNPEFTAITGYTAKEIPTWRRWLKKAYPVKRVRQAAIRAWKESMLGKESRRIFGVACRDGSNRELEFRSLALEDGKTITAVSDVTGQREAEGLFATVAHSSPVGIYVAQDGRFRFINPYFCSTTGFREDEVLGRETTSFIFPEDRERAAVETIQMLKGARLSAFEHRVVNKKGEVRWILETVSSIQYKQRRAVLGNFIDITDRKKAEGKMMYLSLHDNLTGLYNRTYFEEEMTRLASVRFNPVGIVICDVDGLKLINDILGHNAGDNLLVAAADVIKRCFRSSDVVARVGGDEFAILLPNTPKPVVEGICQRIQDTVRSYNKENPAVALSISVGFATKNESSTKMSELFREADNNMYGQKLCQTQTARNNIVATLMRILEKRGVITENRVRLIQSLMTDMGGKLDLPGDEIHALRILAKFRDIGEVGVPDAIFRKVGVLTPEELAEIHRHCEIGYRIAMSTPDLTPVADFILKHHEWWNGEGYPLGLSGKEIPLESRILAICCAYDAMVNDRPYRKAMSGAEALRELKRQAGTQFDPSLVEVFLAVVNGRARSADVSFQKA